MLHVPTGHPCVQVVMLSAAGVPQHATITDYEPGMWDWWFCIMCVLQFCRSSYTNSWLRLQIVSRVLLGLC